MSAAAIPELLIAAGSAAQAERYIQAGADAVLIGEPRFGMRLPGTIPASELAEAVSRIHAMGAKAYVSVNKLFRNGELPELPDYLRTVSAAGADAIAFGDPAVLLSVREYAPNMPLHWNPDMIATNSAAANYWGRRGAVRAVLARELNEEEIAGFRKGTTLEIQVQVHGATNIYHSHRNLLLSYMEHLGKEASLVDRGPGKGLYLVETERPDLRFPVYEDEGGTHVMSADDICLLEAIPDLVSMGVNSLYVEALLKPEAYNETVLRSYRAALARLAADGGDYAMDPDWLEAIRKLQDPERELSFGFLYKEQVY
ncbi:peptidase U32 family protein [Cohnella caldifontis]|uniref:peptidase U32 family protein n=1 Tax=Cohnella caldifontis TaxID=3027471 RepID=UPI0023EC4706|nr:peptidase U32 family protein [Cohnella sp. YIM B05605]